MKSVHGPSIVLGTSLALSLGLFFSACSDEAEKKPCPTKGIGVETAKGVSCREAAKYPTSTDALECRDQVENYKSYACEEPQMCPDRGKVIRRYDLTATSAGEEVSFVLTNCSTGTQKLTVTKLVIYGDARCSFKEAEYGDTGSGSNLPNEAVPGESIAIRTVYKPLTVGDDFAEIAITSNAVNAKYFTPFTVAVCGSAIPEFPAGKDSAVAAPDGGGSTEAGTAGLIKDCKAQGTTLTTKCHKS
jgi:hypothetical protein